MSNISFTAITDGSSIDASDVNGPLNTIYDDYNGSIDSNNLADNAVTTAKITDANVTMPKISNPYKFRVYRNAAYTGVADATITVVDFDAESYDSNNNFDLTTNQYTIPVTGYYQFNFSCRFAGTAIVAAGGYLYGGAAGTSQLASTIHAQASSADTWVHADGLFYCTAGDLINARIYGDVTGTITVLEGAGSTYFSGYLVGV